MKEALLGQTVVAAALGLAAGSVVLATGMAFAQDDTATGPRLTFGINQGLEVSTNAALNPDPAGQTVLATTGLSFGLRDETARMAFALDASTGLRIVDGPNTAGTETTPKAATSPTAPRMRIAAPAPSQAVSAPAATDPSGSAPTAVR